MGGPRPTHAGLRRAHAVALTVILATGLTACTTDDPDVQVTAPTFIEASPTAEPSPEPSTSAAESEEPSDPPTQAAPPLPDAATQQTPEGAVAFTEWWFETLNYATATGDTEALRAASDPECAFCENLASDVEAAYAEGGRWVGGRTDIEVSPPGDVQTIGINLALVATLSAAEIYDARGEVLESFSARESTPLVASVLLHEDGWRMGGVAE